MEVARFLGVWNWSQSLSAAKDLKVIASFSLSIMTIPENSTSSSPAQLGTAAAGVGAKFFRHGSKNGMSHLIVHAHAFTCLERLFHASVFPGVKRENRDPATWFQT